MSYRMGCRWVWRRGRPDAIVVYEVTAPDAWKWLHANARHVFYALALAGERPQFEVLDQARSGAA